MFPIGRVRFVYKRFIGSSKHTLKEYGFQSVFWGASIQKSGIFGSILPCSQSYQYLIQSFDILKVELDQYLG